MTEKDLDKAAANFRQELLKQDEWAFPYGAEEMTKSFKAGFWLAAGLMWHYPSKGDYPPPHEEVLAYADDGTTWLLTYRPRAKCFWENILDSKFEFKVIAWRHLDAPPKID